MTEACTEQPTLTVKLVYYGPALSGKTTNLIRLNELLPPQLRGELITLETRNERTLFFDLLPLGWMAPSGRQIRLRLFSVPGQVTLDSTRKAVLSRAHGIVFVADSRHDHAAANAQSFENLEHNAAAAGLDLLSTPCVVQFNKRDLPAIVSEEQAHAQPWSRPYTIAFASALTGSGVLETLQQLLAKVYDRYDSEMGFSNRYAITRQMFVDATAAGEAAEHIS